MHLCPGSVSPPRHIRTGRLQKEAACQALEAGFSYRVHYASVEVALGGGEFPDWVGERLNPSYPLVLGYDVFVEEELSSGPEGVAYLAHNEIEVLYYSEGEGWGLRCRR